MRKDKQPRIPMLERDQVSPDVGALYDALIEQRGVVPNMFKTIAHTPALALGFAAFLKPLMGDGALPGYYKEIDSYASCPATGLRLLNHRTLCFRRNRRAPARSRSTLSKETSKKAHSARRKKSVSGVPTSFTGHRTRSTMGSTPS